MPTVTATYRLQLHDGFGFADAEAVVPYLARLGVSHLYLSPILQAVAGSQHGYDVVDHTRIAEGLGGRDGFESLARVAHDHGLGIVVDVVPNHMAFVAPENANLPLWQLLRDGRDAATADWFDVDWRAGGGRLGLPVLGDDLETVLDAGELVIDEIETAPGPGEEPVPTLVVRYHDHVYPIGIGTEGDAKVGDSDPATLRAVLDRQHYRLTSWRDKDEVLNYRRFFEVDGLIAVRVELPEVFEATHALLLELDVRGLVDGFRIDHPDGLADPAGYLEQLRRATRRGTLVWVEKILEGDEHLPSSWPCAGTTGYDAMRAIQAALVDTDAAADISGAWQSAGGEPAASDAVEAAKRQVVQESLVPEVDRLTRRAREVRGDLDPERLREAVVELLVAGEVYRAYVRPEEQRLGPEARERLTTAFADALGRRPDLEQELRALAPLATADDESDAAAVDFAVRLQQTWGPVMAKGIEDTTFYRWHRLIALNEVGGDPEDLDHGSPNALHRWAGYQQANWPQGMTTLSTHDTKRSEDVRARLLALAGDPAAWRACSEAARQTGEAAGVDAPTAHFVWQTVAGTMPITQDRLEAYLLKALREGKQHTAWVDGDAEYEERVVAFGRSILAGGPLHDAIARALDAGREAIRATTLAAKTLELTIPGVPDTYQGCEIVDLSLVDPDNRRPVDFDLRTRLLDVLDAPHEPLGDVDPALASAVAAAAGGASAAEPAPDGAPATGLDAEKLLFTHRLLRLRAAEPDLFGSGTYEPLPTDSDHALGFSRTLTAGRIAGALGFGRDAAAVTLVTRAPARLAAAGGWGDATVTLPEGEWEDVVTGAVVAGGTVPVATLLDTHPVAVLLRR
ncbi:malto-oligosyltrehalose synthase [Agilicoccus flavus]|uniref:malto-oligosyltrehalose synthase n=1 Tax=Agilicoccus flavus TaxID=2775968 RepID=UPI001CF6C3C9|nr:malto-oligosyltrehalose synthase [Agilicoccus flavus]